MIYESLVLLTGYSVVSANTINMFNPLTGNRGWTRAANWHTYR